MVRTQIRARGIENLAVLHAMENVPRHQFVDSSLAVYAYEDHPLPIGLNQTISQPYIVAFMTEAVAIDRYSKVLEIGTGSGYQAAMFGEIVKEVYTIELLKPLADQAQLLLEKLGYQNIHVKHGDGYQGWPEQAPFDAIIVTAAPPEIPNELVCQLKVGGRMVAPVGDFYQELILITKTEADVEQKSLLPVRFVPMVKKGREE